MDLEANAAATTPPIEELFVRYAPGAFRLALLLTGDRSTAEDLVQEAFVRVVGRFGHLRQGAAFESYLRRTIVNLTKNTWRRRAVERAHPSRVIEVLDAHDTAILERMVVWRTLQELSERQRVAIVLRFYEDLSEDDIASIMRCPTGTVRSLVSRGMAALRNELGRLEDA